MKQCKVCYLTLPLEAFAMSSKGTFGRDGRCRACVKEYLAARLLKRQEPGWVPPTEQRCSSCRLVKPVAEFHKNKAVLSGYMNNCKTCCKGRYQANAPVKCAAQRAYSRRTRAARNAYQRKWAAENPGALRVARVRRRQNKFWTSLDATISQAEWHAHLAKFDSRCVYCQTPLQVTDPKAKDYATQDHKQPLTRMGVHTLENIVPACRGCNSSKRNRTYDEFLQWKAETAAMQLLYPALAGNVPAAVLEKPTVG